MPTIRSGFVLLGNCRENTVTDLRQFAKDQVGRVRLRRPAGFALSVANEAW